MCRVLGVNPSGYYAWLKRPKESRWQRADRELLSKIKSIYEASQCIYGAPRIRKELRAQGTIASHRRITRIMAAHGMRGLSRRLKGNTKSVDK